MKRRRLVVAGAASALAAPLASLAQQPDKVARVAFLALPNRATALDPLFSGAFPLGMRDLGYVEGRNLLIEWRFADSQVERLPALAAELLQWKPQVLVAATHEAALAAQKATSTIPIVMTTGNDPVAGGLIQSLARPGGNITGLSNLSGDLGPKRLEMLAAMVPRLASVAVLVAASNPGTVKALESLKVAGQKLRIRIAPMDVRTPAQIDDAFGQMRRDNIGALMVFLQPLFQQQKLQLAALAAQGRLPCMAGDQMYAQAGCLMSYGTSLAGLFRRVAAYVDKILKGAKPADLPVEQPTRFDLVIKGKTARALGLTIPQSLLISADKVIE